MLRFPMTIQVLPRVRVNRLLRPVFGAGLCMAAATNGPAAAQPPDGAGLARAWETALAGALDWDRVRTLRYTVTTVWYEPATGEELRRRPRHVWLRRTAGGWQVRVERREAEGRYVQVWDGEGAWATLNGELLPDTAAAVREIPYVAGDLTYWPGLPWKLRDPGVNLVRQQAEGSRAVLHVTFDDGTGLHSGDRFWYYFEPGSPLPAEVHYIEQGRTARQRVQLNGWVSAVPFPFLRSRRYRDEENRPTRAILYSDVQPNRGAPSRLFRRPH